MDSLGSESLLGPNYTRSSYSSAPASHDITNRSIDYYYHFTCFAAGGMSSSIRWFMTPLEIAKTRMQLVASSSTGASSSLPLLFTSIYHEHGVRGLFRGLGPTAAAYGAQTSIKYGIYELLKQKSGDKKWTTQLAAAFVAEAIADIVMCPLETWRVQTQAATTSSRNSSSLLFSYPWASLGPLMARQIPGTMANFLCFETASAYFEEWYGQKSMGTTIAAGYLAGACNAIISHPADSILSIKAMHPAKPILEIVQEQGFWRLATRGLGPRVLMTSNIIGFQWILYDHSKTLLMLGRRTSDHQGEAP